MRYDETVAVLFRKTIKNEVKMSLHRHFKMLTQHLEENFGHRFFYYYRLFSESR